MLLEARYVALTHLQDELLEHMTSQLVLMQPQGLPTTTEHVRYSAIYINIIK